MFLKRHVRRKDGKRHVYYSLTESMRVSRPRTIQRHVLNLGELNTTQLEKWQSSIEVVEESGHARQCRLFTDREGHAPAAEDLCEVLLSTLRVCKPRQFGAPWLGCRLFEELQLDRFFAKALAERHGSEDWGMVVELLVVNRLCAPGSELALHERWPDVFFVIRMATREVQIAGIVPEPHGPWMKQVARNLTDGLDGFLSGCRYLIHDRSSLFTPEFGMILQSVGIAAVRLPARSPNLNAFAERCARTIKEGCLDRMIFIGEASLRRAISEFVCHYHTERNHQSLGNKIIQPDFAAQSDVGEVLCRDRLGGMLRYYHRAAA